MKGGGGRAPPTPPGSAPGKGTPQHLIHTSGILALTCNLIDTIAKLIRVDTMAYRAREYRIRIANFNKKVKNI